MVIYPKIETLFDRREDFSVDTDAIRLPEFELPKSWLVTEKIDGTNIRAGLTADGRRLIGGRTDAAQIPTFLLEHLDRVLPVERLREVFPKDEGTGQFPEVTLFGEGYGPKIQKGGGDYREDPGYILFDVHIGLWLNWENVADVAAKLGLPVVPTLFTLPDLGDAAVLLRDFDSSDEARRNGKNKMPEGIVARTNPLLMTRRGERLMWKLKHSDFKHGTEGVTVRREANRGA